ncbi:hypothetical protein [Aquirufa sp. Wall-65K1]
MKKVILSALFGLISHFSFSQGSTYVNPYIKRDGSTVQGYYKTSPNNTNLDNYSTQGNNNPYNQQQGYKAKDYSYEAQNYGAGQTIETGPRGGQYYYNSNGNKTYVPKQPK